MKAKEKTQEIANKQYDDEVISMSDFDVLQSQEVIKNIDVSDKVGRNVDKIDFGSKERAVEFLTMMNCTDMFYDETVDCVWFVSINGNDAYIVTKENPVKYDGDAQNVNVIAKDKETVEKIIEEIEWYEAK